VKAIVHATFTRRSRERCLDMKNLLGLVFLSNG
jgi:hypothetical protein